MSCSTLSKTLDRSRKTTIDICLLSIASKKVSVTAMLSVSIEWFLRLPLWCFDNNFERAANNNNRRLLDAISWSPSLWRDTTRAHFQAERYFDLLRKHLIMSVRGSRITSRESFTQRIPICLVLDLYLMVFSELFSALRRE